MPLKNCRRCKNDFDILLFSKNKSNPDGHDIYCKECCKLKKLKYKKPPLVENIIPDLTALVPYNVLIGEPKNPDAHLVEVAEEWGDIPGYAGLYKASTFGRIKSVYRMVNHYSGIPINRNAKLLKLHVDKRFGYVHVGLSKHNVSHIVHRLIALTFLPNPDNLPEVNHKNPIKHLNYVWNLEWVSKKGNAQHAVAHGLLPNHQGEHNNAAVLTDIIAGEIKWFIESGWRNCDIARKFNINPGVVKAIKNNKTWTHVMPHISYPF